MEKIYQASFHLPLLLAFTLISIGCTLNSEIKLPEFNIKRFLGIPIELGIIEEE